METILNVRSGHDDDANAKKKKKRFSRSIPLIDSLKLVLVVLLLAASIWMHLYEPVSELKPLYMNTTSTTPALPVEDNPYGFHPFYQVHERVQYTNPSVNLCDGIDPKRTLLLTILSRASNVHIREAIRQTWGAIRIYNDIEIRLMFIVGVDDGMLRQIKIEQQIYHGKGKVNRTDRSRRISAPCRRCHSSQSTGKLSDCRLQRTGDPLLE